MKNIVLMCTCVLLALSIVLNIVCFINGDFPLKKKYLFEGNKTYEDFLSYDPGESSKKITETIQTNKGCVKDAEVAYKIAYAILESQYSEEGGLASKLPLIINYDEEKELWLVRSQLPDLTLGKTQYIVIKKSNAEVVTIWGTK